MFELDALRAAGNPGARVAFSILNTSFLRLR